jgi:polysaccharide biosynthesis/export protein
VKQVPGARFAYHFAHLKYKGFTLKLRPAEDIFRTPSYVPKTTTMDSESKPSTTTCCFYQSVSFMLVQDSIDTLELSRFAVLPHCIQVVLESPSNPSIGSFLGRRIMKSIVQASLAVFIMLTLAVVCAAAQQPTVTATQTAFGYVLGPDDEITIRGIEAPEVSDKPVLIGTNGNITLPLIGRVKAGGLTVEQLEAELNTRFKEFIQDPQISVTVTEFRSQPVSVFGAVTKPGVVQLRGGQTLYEVLSMAGGPRDTAGSILTVTRPRQSGEIPLPGARVDPTGQFSSVELNVQEILEGKNPAANIEIKPNDTISVSEANSNMIYVVGDVEHGGAFTLGGRQSLSVLRALSLAGGLGRTAKPQKALIIRSVPGEPKPQEIAVNIKQIFAGKAEDVVLRPQDVLVVPTSSRKVFTGYSLPAAVGSAVGAAIYHY